MPERQKQLSKADISRMLSDQTVLDTSMTLRDLLERSGSASGAEEVAGYTFAWEKYVFDVAKPGDTVVRPPERAQLSSQVLELNERVQALLDVTKHIDPDEVAGYVYTSDRYTFIVENDWDEAVRPGPGLRKPVRPQ